MSRLMPLLLVGLVACEKTPPQGEGANPGASVSASSAASSAAPPVSVASQISFEPVKATEGPSMYDVEWAARESGLEVQSNESDGTHWKLELNNKAGSRAIVYLTKKGSPRATTKGLKLPRGFVATTNAKGPFEAKALVKRGAARDKATEAKLAAALGSSPNRAPKPQVAKLAGGLSFDIRELSSMPKLKALMTELFGKCTVAGGSGSGGNSQASSDCKKDTRIQRVSVSCRSPDFEKIYNVGDEMPNSAVYVSKGCAMTAQVFVEPNYKENEPDASRELLTRVLDAHARHGGAK